MIRIQAIARKRFDSEVCLVIYRAFPRGTKQTEALLILSPRSEDFGNHSALRQSIAHDEFLGLNVSLG
jgi:hypothetical protein